MMRKAKLFSALVAIVGMIALGCAPTSDSTTVESGAETVAAGVTLCGLCGQVKGSDVCCAADAVKCEKCGLVKGSPGCCVTKTKT